MFSDVRHVTAKPLHVLAGTPAFVYRQWNAQLPVEGKSFDLIDQISSCLFAIKPGIIEENQFA